mgnify:CR=1 FL=1
MPALAVVVDAACEVLGISDTKGLSLMEKAQKCWSLRSIRASDLTLEQNPQYSVLRSASQEQC